MVVDGRIPGSFKPISLVNPAIISVVQNATMMALVYFKFIFSNFVDLGGFEPAIFMIRSHVPFR